MTMILIDKNDRRRERIIRSFSKDRGDDTWRLMFFIEPADVKDTAFLTYDYDEPHKDDDQWMYLPALHKTKRIASSDKTSSFMGSDFSYADMTKRPIELYDFQLVKEMEVRGHPVWVIKSTPRTDEVVERYGYTESLLLVRKDNHVVVRAVHQVEEGGKLKYYDVKSLEKIDGIWTPLEVTMTTKKGGHTEHRTVMKWDDVKYGQDLDPDLFTVRRMEKGL
jgi:hypothetical protein